MTSYINYFIEANLCLSIFGMLYYILFRKATALNFRRFYILITLCLTLILPLLNFSQFGSFNIEFLNEVPTQILPELVVGNTATEPSEPTASDYSRYIPIAYWVMVAIIGQLILFQLIQIAWFAFSNKTRTKRNGSIYIIYTNGTLPTFSFFNLLFFDNSIALSESEKARVFYHEMVHINQIHSLDVLIAEIVKAIFWINPIAWFMRKEIQDVHEYLADDKVIQNTNSDQYSSLLAKMALGKAHLSLGHHFNKSKILKRINMMKQPKHKIKTWKTIMVIPVIALTIIAVSCNDEVMQDVNTVMETATQTDMPVELNSTLLELQQKYPDADFTYIETDGTTEEALQNLQNLDPNSIAHIRVFKENEKVGVIVNKNGPIQNRADVNGVFTIVDEAAIPQGGYQAFYNRLATTLKYPEQARKEGVEGKVFVQFIVEKDGSLSEMKVVKGIGAGCDIAAIEALTALKENWSPPMQAGEPVRQRIILPFTFKLPKVENGKGDS